MPAQHILDVSMVSVLYKVSIPSGEIATDNVIMPQLKVNTFGGVH